MTFQQKLWKAGSAILWAIRPLIGYYLCTGLFMVAGRAIRHMQEQAEMFYGQSSNFYIFWGMVFFWWRMHRRCRKKGITLAEEITLKIPTVKKEWRFWLVCLGMGVSLSLFFTAFMTLLPDRIAGADRKSSEAPAGAGDRTLLVLMLFFLGPVTEEVLFRGYMLDRLLTGLDEKKAIWITAGIFAFCHISPLWILYSFPVGLLLSRLALEKDNVFYPILVHIGFNLPAVIVLAAGGGGRAADTPSGILILVLFGAIGLLLARLLLSELKKEDI